MKAFLSTILVFIIPCLMILFLKHMNWIDLSSKGGKDGELKQKEKEDD